MQPIRHIDRSLAAPSGSRQASSDHSGRKNVNDLRAFYWAGPGWESALKEARDLVQSGSSIKVAAVFVGWSEKDLIEALKGEAHPIFDQVPKPIKKRAPRPLKNRVKGLGPVPKKALRRARQLYEIQYMTVREVAKAINMPYERCYLALQRAGTKFRRPGRRSGFGS